MTYGLYRIQPDDGAGDAGPKCIFWKKDEDTDTWQPVDQERPKVGCMVEVGSLIPRTFQQQDYWVTTPITEILFEFGPICVFKTKNSVYLWREF